MPTYPQHATPFPALPQQPARRARHAKPRRRMRPAARAAIRSVGVVLLTGMAIMAVVGGPGGSAAADATGTAPRTAVVDDERPRPTPLVESFAPGLADLLAMFDDVGWLAPVD